MSYLLIIFIVGVVIFFFLKDRNKMLETQIDLEGGIINKYSKIVQVLTNDRNAKITKTKRDFIEITYKLSSTSTVFQILEVFGGVEIKWLNDFGVLGKHNLNWFFKHPIQEEEILEKIMSDIKTYEKNNL